ncbi:hypothetical protein [Modestobacter sp. I12A-02662]|uniref:hypothetical protein n=1 Tax=Modestobacter sp. I12A-02662 TaxID=1730496 RepID=UPI0034E01A74
MSLVVVHLRWDGVDPEQYEQLCRALPEGPGSPPGCLARQRRRQGSAVLGTEVWGDEWQAELFVADLDDLLAPTGLGRPQVVAFAVPDCFGVSYGVRPAGVRRPASAPVVPHPRSPADARSARGPH